MSQLKNLSNDGSRFADWRKHAANILCVSISFATFLSGCDVESNQSSATVSEESIAMAKPQETTSSSNAQSSSKSVTGTFLETIAAENELFRWSLEIESKSEGGLYAMSEEDFEIPYSIDLANQEKQSREKYSAWIPSFYKGNLISSGWDNNVKDFIGKLESKIVNRHFNVIGRVIAAEWAKDNSVRKISTTDLGECFLMLNADGSEEELLAQLQKLASYIRSKLEHNVHSTSN